MVSPSRVYTEIGRAFVAPVEPRSVPAAMPSWSKAYTKQRNRPHGHGRSPVHDDDDSPDEQVKGGVACLDQRGSDKYGSDARRCDQADGELPRRHEDEGEHKQGIGLPRAKDVLKDDERRCDGSDDERGVVKSPAWQRPVARKDDVEVDQAKRRGDDQQQGQCTRPW